MKKIGIISLFNLTNVNYGNRLQAYALNYYLQIKFPQFHIQSLYFCTWGEKLKTKRIDKLHFILKKADRLYIRLSGKEKLIPKLSDRMERCNTFSVKNMKIVNKPLSWNDLVNSDYDAIIVGSDIVWGQAECEISRLFFLDFKTHKNYKKISYAASFGSNKIPEENKKEIYRCLKDFDGISVREKSGVKLLEDMGLESVSHTVDPTLLLQRKQWENVESQPFMNSLDLTKQYIFVYLLGKGSEERKKIEELAKVEELSIITVPFASGTHNKIDDSFDAVKMVNCSPEEWIWLIHHAEYVITDSFHGTVFSTIFSKKFFVIHRKYAVDINERMTDYIKTIGQEDKWVDLCSIKELKGFEWNYEIIDNRINDWRAMSETYLYHVLSHI